LEEIKAKIAVDAIIFAVLKKHVSDFNVFLKEIEENYLLTKTVSQKKRPHHTAKF